ncbi:hypothetical protein BCR44DRAFT_280458 [Catenaria anguillulae PL171]|uniref:Helicase SMUBP-2/HCS1 1B domain-containing protein n=1 Tax=Catenaria anguillulae PL171 TaxID=765915 RepID=A0A1Y2HN51_9FUNG|nr:hypothetical protein BCR44DRAFT_280458 [Catenaria anguillulae PL171]
MEYSMQPTMSSKPTPKAFLAQLAAAIDAEHQAELAECDDLLTRCTPKQLQDAGLALINLKIAATRTGLGGKCLVDLDPAVPGVLSLPPHKLRNGDIVAIETHDSASFAAASRSTQAANDGKSAPAAAAGSSGVVFRVTDAKITLVCDEDPTDDLNGGNEVRVVKLVNEISHKRLSGVIKSLLSLVDDGKALPTRLMDVLLNGAVPQFDEGMLRPKSAGAGKGGAKKGKSGTSTASSIKWFNPDLNPSQKAAVELALAAQDVALIHGPVCVIGFIFTISPTYLPIPLATRLSQAQARHTRSSKSSAILSRKTYASSSAAHPTFLSTTLSSASHLTACPCCALDTQRACFQASSPTLLTCACARVTKASSLPTLFAKWTSCTAMHGKPNHEASGEGFMMRSRCCARS